MVEGRDGEGRTSGFDRNMKDVRIEVTMREHERPGFERSSMYQRAGFTRARVRVSCRVDCHGRRRYSNVSILIFARQPIAYNCKCDANEGGDTPDHIVDLLAHG